MCSSGPLPTSLGPSPYAGVRKCHFHTNANLKNRDYGFSNYHRTIKQTKIIKIIIERIRL